MSEAQDDSAEERIANLTASMGRLQQELEKQTDVAESFAEAMNEAQTNYLNSKVERRQLKREVAREKGRADDLQRRLDLALAARTKNARDGVSADALTKGAKFPSEPK